MLTGDFKEALELSASMEKRAAADSRLRERKALVDFAVFGFFKEANLSSLGKGLGWGVGLGLPALGVGHMLMADARGQTEDLIDHARNQALMVEGAKAVKDLVKGSMKPNQMESIQQDYTPGEGLNYLNRQVTKLSADQDEFCELCTKLATVMLLDDVLVNQLNLAQDAEKIAAQECLMLNREHGVGLLRKLFL